MRLANAFCRFVELATPGLADTDAAVGDQRSEFEILTLDLV
jgi:hypothetical protein